MLEQTTVQKHINIYIYHLAISITDIFAIWHWGRTGWTSAYHGDMDDPAHQSLG